MCWTDLKPLLTRWWVTGAALLFLLGYWGWQRVFPDTLTRLFQSLPADQGIYLYVDLERLRSAPALRLLINSEDGPLGSYRQAFGEMGFLGTYEPAALAFSIDGQEARLVLHGQLQPSRVRAAVAARNGACKKSQNYEICQVTAGGPSRDLVLALLDEDLVAVAYSLSSGGDPQFVLTGDAGELAPLARAQTLDGAVLWAAVLPSRLDEISASLPPGTLNLTLFARVLKNAEVAYLSIEEEDAPGTFTLRLDAEASKPEDAAELSGLLFGLNQFAAAAADSGRAGSSSRWGRVLRSAEFAHSESRVQAVWSLDPVLSQKHP